MQSIIIIEQKYKLQEMARVLADQKDFTLCFSKDWEKYKQAYLITREPIVLLLDITQFCYALRQLRMLSKFYSEVYLVKPNLKDYYITVLKRWMRNIYEAI